MILAKLYVGMIDKNHKRYTLDDVTPIVNKSFDGYSISQQWGYYHGKREPSLCIEILGEDLNSETYDFQFRCRVSGLCRSIKTELCQECVLVVFSEVLGEFI